MIRLLLFLLFSASLWADRSLIAESAAKRVVFAEEAGIVAIEAEHFRSQERTSARHWEFVTSETAESFADDSDPPHAVEASGGAYLEVLPERKDHQASASKGGTAAVLTYQVYLSQPGRYYCWVRTHSSHSADNSLHLGVNGKWPESGSDLLLGEPGGWRWSCSRMMPNRKVKFGASWIDIDRAGIHMVHFSMREDGAEFDKFILTKAVPDEDNPPSGLGPKSKLKFGKLPSFVNATRPFSLVPVKNVQGDGHVVIAAAKCERRTRESDGSFLILAHDFPLDSPYEKKSKDFIRLNPHLAKSAETSVYFPYMTRDYIVTLMAVGENDGSPTHQILINGKSILDFTVPKARLSLETGEKFHATSEPVKIKRGDVVTVKSSIPRDGDSSMARWIGLRFERP